MKTKLFFTVLIMLVLSLLSGQQPEWAWLQMTSGSGQCIINATMTDSQNRIIIAGTFSGEVSIGGKTITSQGDYDGYIAQLDMNGNWLWAKAFGGLGNEYAHRIAIDAEDNIWVGGSFSQTFFLGDFELECLGLADFFCAKLSPNGEFLAATSFGTEYSDILNGMAISPLGNVYLCGSYRGAISFGDFELSMPSSSYGCFIAKLDQELQPVWAQQLGYNLQPNVYSNPPEFINIGTDNYDNCYLTGNFYDQCYIGNPPGGIILNNNNMSGFVAKLGPDGNALWAERVGTGSAGITNSYTDANGNTYISCDRYFMPLKADDRLDSLPRFAKISPAGSWVWIETFGNMEPCFSVLISGDVDGNCYLTGELFGDVSFGGYNLTGASIDNNIFVAKGNATGGWEWAIQTYDTGWRIDCHIRAIHPFTNGDCVIVGSNQDTSLYFGDLFLPTAENRYSFILRVNAPSSPVSDELINPAVASIQAFPNPSRASVSFHIQTEKGIQARPGIYNLKGQLVKSFPEATYQPDSVLSWDGIDQKGLPCSAGIYFMRLEAKGMTMSKRFIRY